MISIDSVLTLNSLFRLQYEKAQSCHVLLYPEGMVKLNDSAAEILLQVDGRRSLDEICRRLMEKFPGVDELSDDVMAFVSEALAKNWLLNNHA